MRLIRRDTGWVTHIGPTPDVPGSQAPGPAGSWELSLVDGVHLECDVLYPNRYNRWFLANQVVDPANAERLEARLVRELFGESSLGALSNPTRGAETEIDERWLGKAALGRFMTLDRALLLTTPREKQTVLSALVDAAVDLPATVRGEDFDLFRSVLRYLVEPIHEALGLYCDDATRAVLSPKLSSAVDALTVHEADKVDSVGALEAATPGGAQGVEGPDTPGPWFARTQLQPVAGSSNESQEPFRGLTFRGNVSPDAPTPQVIGDGLTAQVHGGELVVGTSRRDGWVRIDIDSVTTYERMRVGDEPTRVELPATPPRAIKVEVLDKTTRLASTRAGFWAAARDLIDEGEGAEDSEARRRWTDAGSSWLGADQPLLAADCFGAAGDYSVAEALKQAGARAD